MAPERDAEGDSPSQRGGLVISTARVDEMDETERREEGLQPDSQRLHGPAGMRAAQVVPPVSSTSKCFQCTAVLLQRCGSAVQYLRGILCWRPTGTIQWTAAQVHMGSMGAVECLAAQGTRHCGAGCDSAQPSQLSETRCSAALGCTVCRDGTGFREGGQAPQGAGCPPWGGDPLPGTLSRCDSRTETSPAANQQASRASGVLYCFIRALFQSIRCQVGVVCVLIAHTVSHTSLPPLPSPKIRAASPCPLFFDPPTRLGCVRSLIIIPQPPAAIIPYLFVNLPPRICLASFFFPFRRLFLSLLVSPSPASRLAIQAARRVCASDRGPSRRSFSTFDTPFPRIRRDKIIRQHHPAPAALNPPAAALAPSTADPQNEHPLERACLPAIQPLTTFYFSSSSSLEHWPRPSASTHCHAATNFDSNLETTVDD
ncbi:hypothetical protein PCL_02404 [Purpureocillium lilacinum]|uniref:Uncharacterized protein n=1 Tax=Purpureocillium lilacinum TaxID=33203 RepID=A0A2U3E0I2_PURLI|nr:hypothetical protein PCL_02404 [Purpureocillium lilacinum]